MDSVARAGGDRTATKPVFPADTGKTDHQKDRIILSLLYKFQIRPDYILVIGHANTGPPAFTIGQIWCIVKLSERNLSSHERIKMDAQLPKQFKKEQGNLLARFMQLPDGTDWKTFFESNASKEFLNYCKKKRERDRRLLKMGIIEN